MDEAAKTGHLDVVRFLHENRSEGCTGMVLYETLRHNHTQVAKFLRANRADGGILRGCQAIFSGRGI